MLTKKQAMYWREWIDDLSLGEVTYQERRGMYRLLDEMEAKK